MPKLPAARPKSRYSRVTALIPEELAVEVEHARARLRAAGARVSLSALIEIALRELLKQRDVSDVLRRHGAKARRD